MQINVKEGTIFRFPLKRSIALAIMIIICVSSVITVMAATITARVVDGEKTVQVEVVGTDEASILKQAEAVGLDPLAPNDKVTFDAATNTVTIHRVVTVTVNVDGTTKTVMMYNGDTVQDALQAAKVTVTATDAITPPKETKLTTNGTVAVDRQHNVSITADGKTISAVVSAGTVENALKAAGITLGKDDILNVKKTAQISSGMKISVNRVAYREVTATQAVAYNTTIQKTRSLTLGTTKIDTAGKNGSQTVVSREKLVDGKVTETKTVSTTVVQQPVDEVKLVGTKTKPSACATITSDGTLIDQSGNEVSYRKSFTGSCTAYTSNGGHTSTGARAQFGYIAVNPNIIAYGTRLYVCSPNGKIVYGYAIAADTGGGVMSGAILSDLYYDTESQCRNFGRRNMTIYVLS